MGQPSHEQGRRISAGPPTATSAGTTTGSATTQPGWTEIITGVAVFLLLSFGGIPLLKATPAPQARSLWR